MYIICRCESEEMLDIEEEMLQNQLEELQVRLIFFYIVMWGEFMSTVQSEIEASTYRIN